MRRHSDGTSPARIDRGTPDLVQSSLPTVGTSKRNQTERANLAESNQDCAPPRRRWLTSRPICSSLVASASLQRAPSTIQSNRPDTSVGTAAAALQITMPAINKMNCGCAKGSYCRSLLPIQSLSLRTLVNSRSKLLGPGGMNCWIPRKRGCRHRQAIGERLHCEDATGICCWWSRSYRLRNRSDEGAVPAGATIGARHRSGIFRRSPSC